MHVATVGCESTRAMTDAPEVSGMERDTDGDAENADRHVEMRLEREQRRGSRSIIARVQQWRDEQREQRSERMTRRMTR